MSQLVTINHATLEQLLYKNVPVVTIQQIADVHGISVKNVHGAFERHAKRFTEGKHYFRLDFVEASQLLTREEANPNGLLLFTEKGYLLLTKPMRDEKAWDVQERMVDEYFVLRQAPQMSASPWDALSQLVETGRQQELKIKALEANQREQMATTIIALQSSNEAKDLALQVMKNQAWVSIRQFVVMEHLERQMPEALQKEYARFLGQYCREHKYPIYDLPVAFQHWDNEHTYWGQAIRDTLPGWLMRRQGQASLQVIDGGMS